MIGPDQGFAAEGVGMQPVGEMRQRGFGECRQREFFAFAELPTSRIPAPPGGVAVLQIRAPISVVSLPKSETGVNGHT